MKTITVILSIAAILILPQKSEGAEPVKVAVIPSILNMFIQYSVLQGELEDKGNLFEQTYQTLKMNVEFKEGLEYSSVIFGTDDKAAAEFAHQKSYPNRRDLYDADILAFIGNDDSGGYVEVFLVAVETGRAISSLVDKKTMDNQNFVSLLNDALMRGLTYANQLLQFDADLIIDPQKSIVQYRLASQASNDIVVNIDYDPTHEAVENVLIYIEEEKEDGEHTFELTTDDLQKIFITYSVKNKSIVDVKIKTDYKQDEFLTEHDKTLTVVSKKGFPVDFVFQWDELGQSRVNILPRNNPYHPHLLGKIR